MFVTIEQENIYLDLLFTYLESYIAFIIAFIIILTSSFGFPFYLTPISLVLMGLFLF
jgi:hypothetical protein